MTDQRIERERQFHDERFANDGARQRQVSKYYAATQQIKADFEQRLHELYRPQQRVLEFGCGTDARMAQLAVPESDLMVGIDLSWTAVALAQRKNVEQLGIDQLYYQQMNAEKLAFRPESFDLVYGTGILHHLDMHVALQNLDTVMKPGATALFIEPLGHNPLINWYRARTPGIRSSDSPFASLSWVSDFPHLPTWRR